MTSKADDLAAELAKITTEVPEVSDAVIIEEVKHGESFKDAHQEGAGEKEPEPEPEPTKEFKTAPNMQARMITSFLDSSGKTWLPDLYLKKMFTAEDIENLRTAKENQAQNKALTKTESELIAKHDQYLKYVKSLPFTKDEVDFLVEPMEAVIEKYGWDLGPEWFLGMSLMSVLGNRLKPIF